MFNNTKKRGQLTAAAKRLAAGCGGENNASGETLSPNSVRIMLNMFRKPLGLALYDPEKELELAKTITTTQTSEPSILSTNEQTLRPIIPATNEQTLRHAIPATNEQTLGLAIPATNEQTLGLAIPATNEQALGLAIPGKKEQTLGLVIPATNEQTLRSAIPATNEQTLRPAIPTTNEQTLRPAIPATYEQTLRPAIPATNEQTLGLAIPAKKEQTLGLATPATKKQTLGLAFAATVPADCNKNQPTTSKSGTLTANKQSATKKKHHQQQQATPNYWKLTTEKVAGISYLMLKQLGKGGCGEVHLVMENESRELYALKKVNMGILDQVGYQECINEVNLLLDLKDTDLVIHIVDWEIDETSKILKIIMEYGQCDLSKTIVSTKPTITKLKSCWENMLQIVQTIHSKGIVHGDLKPANFVWVAGKLKIIDFGIANRLQMDVTSIQTYNPKGTLNFMSPESIRPDALGRSKISPKSDIWSLGCILYLMVYGHPPFQFYPNQISKMNAIVEGLVEYPPIPLQLADPWLLDVLQLCFRLEPKSRPDVSSLLAHPFLTGTR